VLFDVFVVTVEAVVVVVVVVVSSSWDVGRLGYGDWLFQLFRC
jgi:hypothetical protein